MKEETGHIEPACEAHPADAAATVGGARSAAWETTATGAVTAVEESLRPLLRKASEGIYDDLLYTVQEYLLDNILYNVKSQIAAADRQAYSDRKRADAAERAIEDAWSALGEAYGAMGAAFNRIHALPRSEDTAIAERLGRARGRIEALKTARSQAGATEQSAAPGGRNP